MSGRGIYGRAYLGAAPYSDRGAVPYSDRRSSLGTWLIGGLVVGGAVLWAKHQSDQIQKLYVAAGLPYQSFPRSLRVRTGELSGAAGEKLQRLAHRLGTGKELQDGA